MKVHISSTPNKNKNVVLIRKNGLWRVYATRWVGLGLWGKCVSYARQQISYHMHAKVHFCVSIPRVFVFIWRTIYMHHNKKTGHFNILKTFPQSLHFSNPFKTPLTSGQWTWKCWNATRFQVLAHKYTSQRAQERIGVNVWCFRVVCNAYLMLI